MNVDFLLPRPQHQQQYNIQPQEHAENFSDEEYDELDGLDGVFAENFSIMGSGGSQRLSAQASNLKTSIAKSMKKADRNRTRIHGKDERATTEQVLDPRTRMILFKMLNAGILTSIDGCISTGKEVGLEFVLISFGQLIFLATGECLSRARSRQRAYCCESV